jgi:hypothetical protein
MIFRRRLTFFRPNVLGAKAAVGADTARRAKALKTLRATILNQLKRIERIVSDEKPWVVLVGDSGDA